MTIACAVLMCHAPIVVPAIAGSRAADCATTTEAMREAARALVAQEVALCVLVSPHAPRQRTHWGIARDEVLTGSFARFGHAEVALRFPGAPAAAELLSEAAAALGLPTRPLTARDLDHGALVPLYFLREAGYRGRVLLVALPYPDTDSEVRFGSAIRAAAERAGERWAVLASGDMSHRLTPDAPAGFAPRAREFDAGFVERLTRGDLRGALALPRELVDLAAEDVVQSTAVAAGAVGFEARGTRVLAYEGPFGVGYCEALLHTSGAPAGEEANAGRASAQPPRALAELALHAIEKELVGAPLTLPELAPPWDAPRAVFVTLRSPSGELRGCIGRTAPITRSLAAEVADCAIAAATRDYRVPSISLHELSSLKVEVSVLSPPEPAAGPHELDPARYGIVVRSGRRQGVLLPAIEGIDTVDAQLRLALGKAGIAPDAPYRIERFRVDKVMRDPAAS